MPLIRVVDINFKNQIAWVMYDFQKLCCLILVEGSSLKVGLQAVEIKVSIILIYLEPLEKFTRVIWDSEELNERELTLDL